MPGTGTFLSHALSGLYLISTVYDSRWWWPIEAHVSMPSRAYTSFLPLNSMKKAYRMMPGVNALSGLYLISTVPLQKPRFYAVFRACFCRYLSEYSDNSRFPCMLTFWTYLMRCTYPWHLFRYSVLYFWQQYYALHMKCTRELIHII